MAGGPELGPKIYRLFTIVFFGTAPLKVHFNL
jgi:hypothetical protein